MPKLFIILFYLLLTDIFTEKILKPINQETVALFYISLSHTQVHTWNHHFECESFDCFINGWNENPQIEKYYFDIHVTGKCTVTKIDKSMLHLYALITFMHQLSMQISE